MKLFKIIVFLLSWHISFACLSRADAFQFTGDGYGSTEIEARKEALADLSSALQAELYTKYEEKANQLKLSVMGVDFIFQDKVDEVYARAVLDSQKALRFYKTKLKEIHREIKTNQKKIQKRMSKKRQYNILTDLLTEIEQFDMYKSVAIVLGIQEIPKLGITQEEIKERLRYLEKEVDTMDMAVKILTKRINVEDIYVYPPRVKKSNEVTQFAEELRDRLSVYLDTENLSLETRYIMIGEYEPVERGIQVIYRLLDDNHNILKINTVRILPEAYRRYKIRPYAISFDRLFHSNIAKSNNLRVAISTNKGKIERVFKNGDIIKLFIKMNKPGYIFIVGHTVKSRAKHSYILDIKKTGGKRRFIHNVNFNELNKWINLGDFIVRPPFGIEAFQVIASNSDLLDKIPYYSFDKKAGLYIVSRDPLMGIERVRELRERKGDEEELAEAVLMLTTLPGVRTKYGR